jgi:hypothetical protein
MKRAILTENLEPLGLSIESGKNFTNLDGLKFLLGVFAVHLSIVAIGLSLVSYYSESGIFRCLSRLIVFVVPGMSLLLGALELFIISVLAWDKTSNRLNVVLQRTYSAKSELDDYEPEVKEPFPVRQCMEFIESSAKFETVSFEYTTIGMAFAGGRITFKEYHSRVVEIALRLGFQEQ